MSKRGRKSIYDSKILPNLKQIGDWIRNGATEKQICEALGISVSAFNEHKEKKELKETLKENRRILVLDLKGELVQLAKRHTLETKKQYIKKDAETGHETKYTEITTREIDPNVQAITMLLNNLDREDWKPNWDEYEFKKQELELRKKIAEQKDEW